MILKGLLVGGLILIPAFFIENALSELAPFSGAVPGAAYSGFVVAGFTEEFLKYLAVFFIFYRSRQFNERYDGIVYAVSVSLGFAAAENIFYVFSHGLQTGLIRAFTAVPAHAFMGIAMGYYFGLARFFPAKKRQYMAKAFIVPWLLHGIYDFILLSQHPLLLTGFIPLMIFMLVLSNSEMRKHQRHSAFDPKSEAFAETPGEDVDVSVGGFRFTGKEEDTGNG